MIETTFTVGQVVRATTSAQALRAGRRYEIAGVGVGRSGFGTFVTYRLKPHDWCDTNGRFVRETIDVVNGHLILEPAS